ncbi:JAB domain-containing protein [Pirellulaceae bacterium SH449]
MTKPTKHTPNLPIDLQLVREVLVQYKTLSHSRLKVRMPEDIAEFFRSVVPDNSREHMVGLFLDGNHSLIAYSLISTGTANMTVAVPREILQRALLVGAVSLVLAHNHPSESLIASKEDVSLTSKVFQSARLMGILLLDHVIVTNRDFVSLRSEREEVFKGD